MRRPLKGREQDALTGWHHVCHWHKHERRNIKRGYNRRDRRVTRQNLKEKI